MSRVFSPAGSEMFFQPTAANIILKMKIEATGFEPATSASRTQRSTKLSHASNRTKVQEVIIMIAAVSVKKNDKNIKMNNSKTTNTVD